MGLYFERSNLSAAVVLRSLYQRCLEALDIQEQKFLPFYRTMFKTQALTMSGSAVAILSRGMLNLKKPWWVAVLRRAILSPKNPW